jgi:D-alanyl-D-alanine carboxypeptidase
MRLVPRVSLPLLLCLLAAVLRAEIPGVFAGGVAVDAGTGAVLVAENAEVVNPPASMTKLMTFAVLHDRLAEGSLTLQTPVRVEPADSRMGGTQVYLDPRETFTVEELIYAMMVQSANDAAHALARAAAGSVPAFVELMNAKARALGMNATTFRTPHGLPPPSRRVEEGDLSTPRDFAVLGRHLVRNTDVLRYTSVRERAFGLGRAQGPMQMSNHNKLLGKVAGVDGLKTGYTAAAGYCLSATAERGGRRIIVVVMGAFGPGRAVDRGRARDLKAVELLERGFAASPGAAPAAPVVRTAAPAGPALAARTVPPPAAKAAPAADLPVVRTAPPESSTPNDLSITFRVIPPPAPDKKP